MAGAAALATPAARPSQRPAGADLANLPLVITQLPAGTGAETQPQRLRGLLRADYGERARIVLLFPGRVPQIITQGFHSASDPEVSFDGKRIVFAGKRTAADPWDIFELTLADGSIRQITRDIGQCRSPIYQSSIYELSEKVVPWYQITFLASRPGVVNESGYGPAWAIYSCKLDGSSVHRLTYNLSSDVDPHLMGDGRIIYSAWQRRTLEHGLLGRTLLLGINLDGTDCAPYVVAGKWIKHMPCATATGLVVFVEADQPRWDGAGTLGCVTVRRPLHSYRQLTTDNQGLWHSPSPLPDGGVLVSRRPADGSATHAVYRLDPGARRWELVFDDPEYHDIQAKAINARPEPDGRSSSVVHTDPLGKLYCLNVYTTDLKDRSWLPPGTVKTVRVIEGLAPRSKPGGPPPAPPATPPLAPRRILGEFPICEELPDPSDPTFSIGSFNVQVPANTPIELQLLDKDGIALRSCGWIWARSHFSQGCVGCHEDPELTPENIFVAALDKPSEQACVPPQQREAMDFRRDIVPILSGKCLGCHGPQGSAPELATEPTAPERRIADAEARRMYETLVAPDPTSRIRRGKYVDPGRARTSPLVWHLLGRNTSRPWDGPVASRPAKPIPPSQSEPLSQTDRQRLIKWIDLGAPWDGGHGLGDLPSTRGTQQGDRP
ncbi:MAG: HzsA-related protein [Thermoguttaceae bacterium]